MEPASTTTTAPAIVKVFFGVEGSQDCAEVKGYDRSVSPGEDPIEFAFEALLAGPQPSDTDAVSFFSSTTADGLRSVELQDGTLTVDFEDFSSLIPNASSSCGSEALLAQLKETAFQFPEVAEVEFQFEGSCDAFYAFLQMSCTTLNRSGF